MIKSSVIFGLFDDLFRQIDKKAFSESVIRFVESVHTHYCRFGFLSKKQARLLAIIRNNNYPYQIMRTCE